MDMEDSSLGLAGVDDSTSSLHLWSRTVKGAAKWVQCMVIDLEKAMPMANPREGHGAYVVGFAEGVVSSSSEQMLAYSRSSSSPGW